MKIEIPYKFPSLNEYINACRGNRYAAASMKKQIENDIGYFINRLPEYEHPIIIHFTWVEGNKRRDTDNIAFGKKFILDALVKHGKIKDDNPKYVKGFTDEFEYDDEFRVIVEVEEL